MLLRAGGAASVSVSPKPIHTAGGVEGLRVERGGEKEERERAAASRHQRRLSRVSLQLEHDHLARHTQLTLAELCPWAFQHQVTLQQQ